MSAGYSALPRLTMGHSLGALMHVLLACLENSDASADAGSVEPVAEAELEAEEAVRSQEMDEAAGCGSSMSMIAGSALISYNNKGVDGAIPFFKELFVPAFAPLEPLTRDPQLEVRQRHGATMEPFTN